MANTVDIGTVGKHCNYEICISIIHIQLCVTRTLYAFIEKRFKSNCIYYSSAHFVFYFIIPTCLCNNIIEGWTGIMCHYVAIRKYVLTYSIINIRPIILLFCQL